MLLWIYLCAWRHQRAVGGKSSPAASKDRSWTQITHTSCIFYTAHWRHSWVHLVFIAETWPRSTPEVLERSGTNMQLWAAAGDDMCGVRRTGDNRCELWTEPVCISILKTPYRHFWFPGIIAVLKCLLFMWFSNGFLMMWFDWPLL